MVPTQAPLHLAVALDGAGWHPAAWRESDAQPDRLFTADYWTRAGSRPDTACGLPTTRHIGFVPTAITAHTEPFHLSKAIATLDYVSSGRAGIRVQVGARAGTAAHFGRREIPPLEADRLSDPDVQRLIADHFDEAADYVEVLRRLWDSWEDGAEIRDVATGRFIDRDKLHYIDFEGRWFSVKGPSITPRPPQGQPVVAALGHASVPYRRRRRLHPGPAHHPGRAGPVRRPGCPAAAGARRVPRRLQRHHAARPSRPNPAAPSRR